MGIYWMAGIAHLSKCAMKAVICFGDSNALNQHHKHFHGCCSY